MAERGRARTQGIAGTWPPREAARAGGIAPSGFAGWSSFAAKLRELIRAEAGAGGCCPGCPWRSAPASHSILRPIMNRSCRLPRLRRRGFARRRSCCGGAAFSRCGNGRGGRRGLCHRDLEDGADRARRAGAAHVRRLAVGLRRDPRYPASAPTVLSCASRRMDSPRSQIETGARAAVGPQGHRARGRQFC